jgi:hypothetical protein
MEITPKRKANCVVSCRVVLCGVTKLRVKRVQERNLEWMRPLSNPVIVYLFVFKQ